MFMGWYSKTSQPNTTLETTKSIPKPQSTVMEGLTEQTELLKAKRDAMALPLPTLSTSRWFDDDNQAIGELQSAAREISMDTIKGLALIATFIGFLSIFAM